MFLHNLSVTRKGALVTLHGTENLVGESALDSNEIAKEFEHTYDAQNDFELSRLVWFCDKYEDGWRHKGLKLWEALKKLEKISQDLDSENKGIYVWEYWLEEK